MPPPALTVLCAGADADERSATAAAVADAGHRVRTADPVEAIEAALDRDVDCVDPASQDERTIHAIKQVFDGEVQFRDGEDGPEIRIRGLADQPDGWLPFDPQSRVESAN